MRGRDVVPGLKTRYELNEFNTSNHDVVEILLYAASPSLLVSRDLLDSITNQADDKIVYPSRNRVATFHAK